jgi:opacity protein-like surface antigen
MKLFTYVIIALMFSSLAMAAEVPTSEGDKAMVFMFNGFDDLGLGGYMGDYGVGMRYYIADGTAVRFGLQFANHSATYEDFWGEGDDAELTESMYGVSAVYEKHLEAPCASVSPYWGVGVAFQMLSTEYTLWPVAYDDYWDEWSVRDDETDKATRYGIFGALGFEWAFTNCMTLGGEYMLGYWAWSGETECPDTAPTRDTCDKWSESWMGLDAASVYLSVYW